MHQITIDNFSVKIQKHRFSRKMRLSISPEGNIKLTMPYFLPYLAGRLFILEKKSWILDTLQDLQTKNPPKPKHTPAQLKDFKRQALVQITELVRYYSQLYQVKPGRLSIKNQQTLWGSCSRRGNLNFNWRLILFPEQIRRYLVVHELCHLREMNHSEKFWKLVALTVPDYKLCRKWLRDNIKNLY